MNEDLLFITTPDLQSLEGEIVEYAIIANPAISISTGLPSQFSMNVDFKLNYAFMPNPANLFAEGLSLGTGHSDGETPGGNGFVEELKEMAMNTGTQFMK